MTNTIQPEERAELLKMLRQRDASFETARIFREAARRLEDLGSNEVMRDELERLNTVADEYEGDAEEIFDRIADRWLPEEVEEALTR